MEKKTIYLAMCALKICINTGGYQSKGYFKDGCRRSDYSYFVIGYIAIRNTRVTGAS